MTDADAHRSIAVGMLWHSVNSGNLGVGALTVSNLALARQAAAAAGVAARFQVLGFVDPGVPHYVAGDDVGLLAINTRAMAPGGAFWRAVGGLDCVLDIGAGDSFADIYGAKRFGFLWLSKVMTVARNVPLALSPQTIGPFTKEPQKTLAAAILRRAEFVMARDPLSFDVARALAPRTAVIQGVDVAFALPYDARRKADPRTVEVGINVSGLLFNRGYSGANEFGMQVDYAAFTRQLIAALQDRPGLAVHLICHVNSETLPQDDDGRVADLLAKEFPKAVRVPNFASPSEAKSYIAGLDFLIGGRMHACIAAFSAGVPVVPVAYSRKFTGLFEALLGYPHLVPVKGLETGAAVQFVLDRLDRRAELQAEVAHGNAKVETYMDAYRSRLTQLFHERASRRARAA